MAVLQAAARISAIAEELATALERLPKILDLTHSTLQIFKDYKGMHSCSANLFTAVLSSLLTMIRYLQKKSYRESPILHGPYRWMTDQRDRQRFRRGDKSRRLWGRDRRVNGIDREEVAGVS